jgi:hypothetical protein
MPEEIEIDTDKLHEAIHEEVEKEGGALLRTVALTTALFAAVAAIGSLEAGGTVNEALALKTESTQLQAKASDQWAYYQAKGVKASVAETHKDMLLALGKTPSDEVANGKERYTEEQKKIKEDAEELEKKRDEKAHEADHLMHKHHFYAQAVALLQVAIAFGAVAALTRKRPAWIASTVLGIAGVGVIAWAFFMH